MGARADVASTDGNTVRSGERALELAVTAAQNVLSGRFGAAVRLAEPEDLGGSERSTVLRARVAETPFTLPKTLVVKHYGPSAGATAAESFAREAVSYQLFTALSEDERMCPELFAHDAGERVLVLEDLGHAPTLADKLLGRDATAAERSLLTLARSLGRLHATTAGREADFDALVRRIGTDCGPDPLARQWQRAARELPEVFTEALGIELPQAGTTVPEQVAWLLEGSKHRAFSPDDLCPDNNMITSKGARFLDFEGGRVREVLLDAAYLRVPFPSCWCAFDLPRGMSEAMLAAWRAEVTGMWPEFADDEVLEPQLLDAQLFWVQLSTWWFLPRAAERNARIDDYLPSPKRAAALYARWQRLAEDAERLERYWLYDYASAVVDGLADRFEGELTLASYPAFR
ncbi:hypothetical protein [Sciscionella marina]|uniref:hypothetical protein n=1 Tax=Sciscionella marina TaxID=508770 RepID=UPI00036F9CBC|nr:hypothetical protein [Sciscionella marina]